MTGGPPRQAARHVTRTEERMLVHRTRVKICGVTCPSDAQAAVAAGADAVGVVLADGPRSVSIDEALAALDVVPPFVGRVGVFVDAPLDHVREAACRLRLSAVQLHGDEDPGYCSEVGVPVIKAFKVGIGFAPSALEPFRGSVAAVLLDTLVTGKDGGTGITFPWQSITDVPGWATLVVAGGLTPVNVGVAIDAMRPFGVNVSSGVEERPRHKDREKLRAFVAAVRAADEVAS